MSISTSTALTNRYDIGDLVRISGSFVDDAGDAANPVNVTIQYKNPSGEVTELVYGTDPEVQRPSTGEFYVDITVDEPGYWFYRIASSGIVQDAAEGQFFVKESYFSG